MHPVTVTNRNQHVSFGVLNKTSSRRNLLAISHELNAFFSLEITPKKANIWCYVFCSNTLIFAPECWKCTLRCPDFKLFPGGMPLDFPSNLRFQHLQVTPWVLSGTVVSFLYHQLQSFCHLLKTLLKTLFHIFNHYLLIAWYYTHLARSKTETSRLNVLITFFWKLKFNVKEKLLLK